MIHRRMLTPGGKLAALEEFKIQKEDYVLQMATLREQIAQQEADHKEEIYRLERKQVVDKDRWVMFSMYSSCKI